MGFFGKKGLPRSHLLWRPLGTFTATGTEVFLEARAIKSPFLPVHAKDSPIKSNKERLATWTAQYFLFKNQRRHCWQTVNILSCSFLPDAVIEPTPPGTMQFETVSTWFQFSVWDGASNSWTRKLDWVSRTNIFPKKGLPRGHWLVAALGTFTTIGTAVFSWGTCNQVTVLACACERQSEQFEQGKTCHGNYIIIHFQKTKEGIVGKPSTFFLAAFCLMQWLSQHLWERCSLKPCPPDFSLSWQFTVISKVVPATPEHASLALCPEWVSLPRRACLLWRPLGLSRQLNRFFFFRHVQSSHRSCLCVRKTVRTIRTRKDLPYELYNNSFLKN